MRTRTLLIILIASLLMAGCNTVAETPLTPVETLSYADELYGAVFNPPRPISDFTFASTTGEPFILSEHKGEIILIYFGYRACPDFCPTTFTELKKIYAELGQPADQLKVVFVTVDPDRDTLENLTLYTQAFNEDFIAVREEGDALQKLMDEFGVVAEKQPLGDSALSYLIDHTASLFAIGPDGNLQVQFLYGTDYREILHDLKIMLNAD